MTRDPDHTAIRRRPDGSIDTGHYLARGRGLQAAALRATVLWLIACARSTASAAQRGSLRHASRQGESHCNGG